MQLAAPRTTRRDVARLTSTLVAPAPVAGALLLCVACYDATTLADGLAVGVLLALCATVPSTLYIEHVVRRDGMRRRYLARSSERLAPLAIGCASVLVCAVVVGALGAPRDLRIVLMTMLFVLGSAFCATPRVRVSVHVAAAAGSMVLLELLFGGIGIALLPIVVLVGWSRLELGEHTPAQVVAGGMLGVIGASAAYAVGSG